MSTCGGQLTRQQERGGQRSARDKPLESTIRRARECTPQKTRKRAHLAVCLWRLDGSRIALERSVLPTHHPTRSCLLGQPAPRLTSNPASWSGGLALVVSSQRSGVFGLAHPPPNAPRINTRQPARLTRMWSAHVAEGRQRMDDVPRDQAVERGTARREDERGRKMEERRQAWRIHIAHSPALYMFVSAVADDGQPLRPRSTPTVRRRGVRGREEAKKRGRTEPIARGDRPVTCSMWTSA
ncbi:hypothetical protein C8Q76DRAFT_230332 [Earliella scabrosa]|nr:hypothetical protein C8Q76DRAFT_230332 [Earliella scabrosa]